MRYRELGAPGHPGLRVSEIGFGTREIGGTVWLREKGEPVPYGLGEADDDTSVQTIARARHLGMNFILTSPAHGDGHGQEVVGRVIARDRDYWVVGALGGLEVEDGALKRDFSYDTLVAGLDASIERLKSYDVDLFMLDNPTQAELDDGACLEALQRIERTGKAGFVGVDISNSDADLAPLLDARVNVVGVRYNIFEAGNAETFALARSKGVGIVAQGVLADGLLTGTIDSMDEFSSDDERSCMQRADVEELIRRAAKLSFLASEDRTITQAALLYVLANRGVSVALTGAFRPKHVEEDVRVGNMRPLADDELSAIARLQRDDFPN